MRDAKSEIVSVTQALEHLETSTGYWLARLVDLNRRYRDLDQERLVPPPHQVTMKAPSDSEESAPAPDIAGYCNSGSESRSDGDDLVDTWRDCAADWKRPPA